MAGTRTRWLIARPLLLVFCWSAFLCGDGRSDEFVAEHADIHAWDKLLTDVLADALGSPYVDERKWGKKKNLTVGVKLHREGLLLKPQRRRKTVNHGDWERYEIRLDPRLKDQLKLETTSVRQGMQTQQGQGVEFDARLKLPLKMQGRISKWERGIQLYSFEALADATVTVDLHCQVGAQLDLTEFPPRFIVKPRVTSADVQLESFKLHRISNAKGALVKELGKILQRVANEEIKDRQGDLVKKINRKLEKWSEEQ